MASSPSPAKDGAHRTVTQKAAILAFFDAVQELKESMVIRSDRYLGDLAEFLCADEFQIDLAKNLREAGYDGTRGPVKVQVKYGGGKKTNVDLGDPDNYEEIYIVLGRGSVVRAATPDGDFIVYRLTADQARKMKTRNGKYSCGAQSFVAAPLRTISISAMKTSVNT